MFQLKSIETDLEIHALFIEQVQVYEFINICQYDSYSVINFRNKITLYLCRKSWIDNYQVIQGVYTFLAIFSNWEKLKLLIYIFVRGTRIPPGCGVTFNDRPIPVRRWSTWSRHYGTLQHGFRAVVSLNTTTPWGSRGKPGDVTMHKFKYLQRYLVAQQRMLCAVQNPLSSKMS